MKKNTMLSLLMIVFAGSTCFTQMYTVTDVGTLPASSPYSLGTAVSNSGEVVGYASADFNPYFLVTVYHPFSYSKGVIHDLGALPGADPSAWAFALDVNESGQVVGYGHYGSPLTCCHAFLDSNGTMQDLGTLGGVGSSTAVGINKSGVVVGWTDVPWDQPRIHAAFYDGAWHDLGIPPGYYYASAVAINSSGEIAVTACTVCTGFGSPYRTFLHSGGQYQDIGQPSGGALAIVASDLNDSGQIVGYVESDGHMYGYVYSNGAVQQLPLPAGYTDGTATEINNSGEIVGFGYTSTNRNRALLWQNGKVTDLNTMIPPNSGWGLEQAEGINENGQIVVLGLLNDIPYPNVNHALLLTPIYKALLRPPINPDGSSVFFPKRGVIPVKFTLTKYNLATCTLPPAALAVTRTAGGTLGSIANGPISSAGCQYHYNLATSELGAGVYRADISINGIMVGHAVFALK